MKPVTGNLYFLCPFSGRIFTLLLQQEQWHLAPTLFFPLRSDWRPMDHASQEVGPFYWNVAHMGHDSCFMSILSLLRDCVSSCFLPLEMADEVGSFSSRSAPFSLTFPLDMGWRLLCHMLSKSRLLEGKRRSPSIFQVTFASSKYVLVNIFWSSFCSLDISSLG